MVGWNGFRKQFAANMPLTMIDLEQEWKCYKVLMGVYHSVFKSRFRGLRGGFKPKWILENFIYPTDFLEI